MRPAADDTCVQSTPCPRTADTAPRPKALSATQLTIRQDRANFSDEQVEATIAGYNAFIDDIERVVEGLQRA